MNRITNYINKYLFTSIAFCGIAKTIELWDAKANYYNNENGFVKKNILISEKIGLVVAQVFIGPSQFPFKLFNYISCIEMKIKNENPKDYGFNNEKKYVIDYLW